MSSVAQATQLVGVSDAVELALEDMVETLAEVDAIVDAEVVLSSVESPPPHAVKVAQAATRIGEMYEVRMESKPS